MHCHGKTRHRPACSSGGDEGTEMNRPSCALLTALATHTCRGASGGLQNRPAELSQPSGDHQIHKNIRLLFKHGGLVGSVTCISWQQLTDTAAQVRTMSGGLNPAALCPTSPAGWSCVALSKCLHFKTHSKVPRGSVEIPLEGNAVYPPSSFPLDPVPQSKSLS